MNSVIFQTAARVLLPFMLILSIIVLLRGHNEPGGGFVGGLLAASGFALYALAIRVADARRMLRVDPLVMIAAGLAMALLSGVPAMISGAPFLEGRWASVTPPGFIEAVKVGTPLVFDIGVYVTVLGVVTLMVFSLEESRHDAAAGG
jgi:multisubunit Na+/H+ antiporter MnhB subunit